MFYTLEINDLIIEDDSTSQESDTNVLKYHTMTTWWTSHQKT